jgi:uncharacterized protein YcgI (DUF1989 family)
MSSTQALPSRNPSAGHRRSDFLVFCKRIRPNGCVAMKPRPQDLTVDQLSYYAAVSADVGARKSISRIYIPKQAGKACAVAAHQVLRVTCCDGPQVADFNAFAQNDPSEYFWSGRTRTLQGSHLHVGDRLWSTEPKMRPIFTFITDTVAAAQRDIARSDLFTLQRAGPGAADGQARTTQLQR